MPKFLLVLIASVSLTSCGDSHEAVVADAVKTEASFWQIVYSVRNADDAKAAIPKIEELTASIKKLTDRVKSLGPVGSMENWENLWKDYTEGPLENLQGEPPARKLTTTQFEDAVNDFNKASLDFSWNLGLKKPDIAARITKKPDDPKSNVLGDVDKCKQFSIACILYESNSPSGQFPDSLEVLTETEPGDGGFDKEYFEKIKMAESNNRREKGLAVFWQRTFKALRIRRHPYPPCCTRSCERSTLGCVY